MPRTRKKKSTTVSVSEVFDIIENFLKKKYKDSFESLNMPECKLIKDKESDERYFQSNVTFSTKNRIGAYSANIQIDANNGNIINYEEKYHGFLEAMFE